MYGLCSYALTLGVQYGYQIGMAFQMVDDILDFTGEQATMGKPVASDLRQGLITLPAIYYLESNPKEQYLQEMLESNFYDEERIGKILAAIRNSGAIQKSLDEANLAIERGLQALKKLPETPERWALEDLAHYIVAREI